MPNKTTAHFSARKRLIVAAISACFVTAPAWSNPTAPQVVNGSASFNQAGKLLTVTNTNGAIINWNTFSIGANETTRFNQSSASSSVLNRVLANDPSVLLGTLSSNGRVWLVNPAGIMVGQGARIDVAGFVASTLNVRNEDFLAGRLNFGATPNAGKIENQGRITTPSGGSVYLIAPAVENHGIINAPNGEVILAAGQTVQLVDTGTPGVKVDITGAEGNVTNLGEIVAEAGRIGMAGVLVTNTGTLNASSLVREGGRIFLKASRNILSAGRVSADGLQGPGGEVDVQAGYRIIQTAAADLSADSAYGNGGTVTLQAVDRNFASGTLSATGGAKGGDIKVLGNDIVLLGATADASGGKGGGTILVGGDFQGKNAAIANAMTTGINFSTKLKADATGSGDGGKVIVWSDSDTKFYGTVSARGGAQSGNGGFMEISGKESLTMGGFADAGAANGKPGSLLLDPKNIIIDSAGSGLGSFQLADPNPGANEFFGQNVTVLPNQNVVVIDSNDSFAASGAGAVYLYSSSNGALLSALTGSQLNDRVGSNGTTVLPISGNYVVNSPFWANGTAVNAGAVTFGNATTGVSGVVSAANSLVGSTLGPTAADFVGSGGIVPLTNGNYLVLSPFWSSNGSAISAGAVTFGSGTTGVAGVVSASNSLVGSATNDLVGGNGIIPLSTGNYLVNSRSWGGGAGAVTFGNGTNGVSGVVSAANSLVGSAPGDQVGSGGVIGGGSGSIGFNVLPNGNYLVLSPNWSNTNPAETGGPVATNAGAVSFGSGTTGVSGAVSSTNSLVGSTAGDQVGGNGIRFLSTGNYLVHSTNWSGGAGAVTFGDGTTGVSGVVSATNSLVGGTAGDQVGSGGVIVLSNGSYVVVSPSWTNANTSETVSETPAPGAGAVTFGSGATGVKGLISSSNSLVGNGQNYFIGRLGITELTNGNYVVASDWWSGTTGAVTWVDGSNGNIAGSASPGGVVSGANSLVGSANNDFVGSQGFFSSPSIFEFNGVHPLPNGNYVVVSNFWTHGTGAATLVDGTNGNIAGSASPGGGVSAVNSLVGSVANTNGSSFGTGGDLVGSNGIRIVGANNYVVMSPNWNSGAGAVTFGDGSVGVSGVVSDTNSLVGSTAGDHVGSDIRLLGNGNYVVLSPNWTNATASAPAAGAVTFGSGTTGVSGFVSQANSLVGSTAGDQVGNNGMVELNNGNYVVLSPNWSNTNLPETGGVRATNAGAVTFGSGTTGVSGVVSSANSLVGNAAGDLVGNSGIRILVNDNYVVLSPSWHSNTGAATFVNGTTGIIADTARTGDVVSASNSLVGSTAGDQVGSSGIVELTSGNYVVLSPNWSNTTGAVTFGNGTTGVSGPVSSANSLVGNAAGDQVGSGGVIGGGSGNIGFNLLPNGNYLVLSPNWSNTNGAETGGPVATNAGAVTFGSGATGVSGAVSSTNSLVGNTSSDQVGGNGIRFLNAGNYLVNSNNWGGGAGAVTFGDGTSGVSGLVSAANSLVGSTPDNPLTFSSGDHVGSGGVITLSNGNYVVRSPNWNSGAATNAGAVTFGSGITGVKGVVSAANSLVGGTAGDQIGGVPNCDCSFPGSVFELANGNYVVSSPNWTNPVTGAASASAVTFGSGTTGVSGLVSPSNSLVGSAASDNIGSGGITELSNGSFIVRSPDAANGGFSRAGLVHVVAPSGAGDPASGQTFAATPSSDVTITPASITAITNTGTAVVLQANNDITLAANSNITTSASGAGGALRLQAGRSIQLNSIITTDNGNFTAIAGDPGADAEFRDPGTPTLGFGHGASLNVGTGTATLAAIGGSFVNDSGSVAPITTAGAGRWLLYSADPASNTSGGMSADFKRYNCTFADGCLTAGTSIASTGNGLLYSLAPVLTVTPDIQAMTYGNAGYTGTLSGFIDGDTAAATSGTAAFSVGGAVSSSGRPIVGTHDLTYSGGLASTLGYQFQDAAGSTNELTVNARALNVTATGVNKVYDGLLSANSTLSDNRLAGDVFGLSGSGSFADKNVGVAKPVSVSGITLTGSDAGNYTLSGTTAATTADITVRPLSTWIGGATGNWSLASNWDAIPDLSNVLAVTVPTGTTVTYDAGIANIASLTAGGLNIAGGVLNIANKLTISSNFSQAGGTLGDFAGGSSASITQASGNLILPKITVANLALNAPAGAITQSGRLAALTLTTQSQGATTLNNPDNQISNRVDMTAGGPLVLWASGDLNLGAINAGTNSVVIKAGGAVLKAAGTETSTNIIAGAADLSSIFGGKAGDLAISADTQITGALTATVGSATAVAGQEADFGGIRIKNTGAQPASVILTDNALAGASVSFLNTGDITTSASGFTLETLKGGDLALLSNGNITWGGGSLSTPSGSVLMSAEGSIAVTGALSSPVDLALSSKVAINVNGSGNVGTTGTGTASFTAPNVAINGSVNAADDVGIIADTLNLGAGSRTSAGHDAIFAAGNITATNATVSAAHDISAAVTGDLRLNGSSFTARNDIFITMLGATSTLYLNDAAGLPQSFLWAQAPSTIHLEFSARGSEGMVVDGVAADPLIFVAAAGGSGLFNGAARAPATVGAGLEVVYGTTSPGTTVAPSIVDAVLAAITRPPPEVLPPGTFGPNLGPQTGLGGTPGSDTIGGTEDSFGGSTGAKKDDEDKKDKETGLKKQADKPTAKKLATCGR